MKRSGRVATKAGQALVIVLLVLSVVLTVGLSVVAQSVSEIKLSQKEEEAARAFSAAEAGIDRVLIATDDTTSGSIGDAQYQVVRTDLGQGATQFLFPNSYSSGESATLYLVPHNVAGSLDYTCPGGSCYNQATLNVCWGNNGEVPGSGITPALELAVIYREAGNIRVARMFNGIGNPNNRDNNSFTNIGAVGCVISGTSLPYLVSVNFGPAGLNIPAYGTEGTLVAIRAKMHYNSVPQKLGVNNLGEGLPSQGVRLGSVGTYGNSTQKVELTQLFSDAPAVLDYALYSGTGGIVK